MRLDLVLDNILCALALVSGTDAAAVCPRASKGCGQSHTFVGESREFTFESDGINRTYRIHLPKSYDKDHSQPLFLFYHGKGGQPKDIEYGTQLSTEEVNPNMVAVYPAGVNVSSSFLCGGCSLTDHSLTEILARPNVCKTRYQ